MQAVEDSKLGARLAAPMNAIIEQHRSTLLPMLAGKSGELSRSALQNDEAVRTVAGYCYALLPGLVRLAVKEPVFIGFVMTHRETVLAKLVPAAKPD